MPPLVAFDATQPQKPENRANIKFENNSNDGFNYFESVNIRLLTLCAKVVLLFLDSFVIPLKLYTFAFISFKI
jgi:hypothetical protein